MRVGVGYDVHPLVSGRRLVLGGVEIPFEKGLDGHSDADVLVHAIIDALLGATSLGDIGTHFPSTDPRYKDVSSVSLLRQVSRLVRAEGWRICNVDATIVAEQPRLTPFVADMRGIVGEALGIDAGQVGVKSTTAKGLGFLGSGQGIAVHAVALVERPNEQTADQ
jgi:2-C-methyl-D-erythritol 2,4-cyclodiphosphate synthase